MMQTHIVVGQSGAGKTTFVRESWYSAPAEVKIYEAASAARGVSGKLPYTVCGTHVLLGIYEDGRRCCGTDTLQMNCKEPVKEWYAWITRQDYDNVVMEGLNITSRNIIDSVIEARAADVTLYFAVCGVLTSLARVGHTGVTEKFIKSTQKRAFNLYRHYKGRVRTRLIKTGE
jgi:hypothetical protein